jgi:phenylalanine ammonia-lyase
MVDYALKNPKNEKLESTSVFQRIPMFEKELKASLDVVIPSIREAYDTKGYSSVPNRIQECRTYPLYKFVRSELGTELLSGLKTVSPGQEIEKVYNAICEGKLVTLCLNVLKEHLDYFFNAKYIDNVT